MEAIKMDKELTHNLKKALAYEKNTRISVPSYDVIYDDSIILSISIGRKRGITACDRRWWCSF
jgi:hypothetical protein